MSTSSVVNVVASWTNVRHQPDESYEEYLERLDAAHGVDESDRERLKSLAEKELFTPSTGLSESEKREIREICNRVLEINSTESNSNQKARVSVPYTDSDSSAAQHGDTFNDVRVDDPTDVSPSARVGQHGTPSQPASNTSGRLTGVIARLPTNVFTGSDVVYLLPLLGCAVFVFFYGLGSQPLSTWDEAFYGNLARHMVQDGYWIVPHMYYAIGFQPSDFEPWLRLPPFGIWLQAIAMLIFGVNEFAVRLPSAVASALTVVVVYLVGRDIESRRAGFVAGLVYLTTPYVYAGFNAGRDGALDSLLVLFGSLFVYTTWLAASRGERRWLYPMGLFAGLAVLTKGFGAGVFLIVALPLVFFAQRVFLSKQMGYVVGLTGLLTLPWPIYIYAQYRETFVREFFVRYVFERAAGGAFGANTNTLFSFMEYPYITELLFAPDLLHPWTFILIIGAPVYAYRRFTIESSESALEAGFLVWWIVATFGLFVFIGNKVWYILPMYVPAAVVVGGVVDDAIAGRLRESLAVTIGAGIVLTISPEYSFTITSEELVAPGVVLAAAVVLVVWFAPIRGWLDEALPMPGLGILSRVAPLVIALILIGSLVGTPVTSAASPQQSLAEELNRQSPETELVYVESGLEVAFHTFSFYAQRPLESGPVTRLDSSGARYAILTEDSLSETDVNITIITNRTVSRGQQVSLVKITR